MMERDAETKHADSEHREAGDETFESEKNSITPTFIRLGECLKRNNNRKGSRKQL